MSIQDVALFGSFPFERVRTNGHNLQQVGTMPTYNCRLGSRYVFAVQTDIAMDVHDIYIYIPSEPVYKDWQRMAAVWYYVHRSPIPSMIKSGDRNNPKMTNWKVFVFIAR